MKKSILNLVIVASTTALVACGSGSNNTVANQDPQGFWLGTSATGYNIAAVVLENGQYYSLFSKNGIVEGANYGAMTVSGTNFSGSLDDIYIPGNKTNSGTIAGTFSPKSKLDGIASYSNNTYGAFTTTYNAAYDTPATLSAIAGQYIGPYKSGATAVLNVAPNGSVEGTTTAAGATLPKCLITGSALPRASGKNVYDLTLQWHDNPALPGNSCCLTSVCATGIPTTGIAVLDVANATTLYTAWINSAKTSGFLWAGQKQ